MGINYCPRCRKKNEKYEEKLMCSGCGFQLSTHRIFKKYQKQVLFSRLKPILSLFFVFIIIGGSFLFIFQRSDIGKVTENGGIIFFDKLFYSNGWRYMEVSPVNLQVTPWSSTINEKAFGEMSGKLGLGAHNSYIIVNRFGATSAAYKATNYGDTEDWFLGNKLEMKILYHSLKLPSVKKSITTAEKFSTLQNQTEDETGRHVYWVSELDSKDVAYAVNFEDGETLLINTSEKCFVRPIRKF